MIRYFRRTAIFSVVLLFSLICFNWHVGHCGNVYYVSSNDPLASDINPGSAEEPLLTLGEALSRVTAGDTVVLEPGTYRESMLFSQGGESEDFPVTVRAGVPEAAFVLGSDVVVGWEHAFDETWVRHGWEINSQQVFVDGLGLQQIGPGSLYHYLEVDGDTALPVVGSDFSDMYPGSFWYDEDMGSLYVWLPDGSSPENYVMEASVRDFLLAPNSLDYINLEGLVFAHSNTGTSGEEVSMLNISGTGWKLEDNFFLMADMSGLSLSGRDHLLSGNTFLLNGYAGLVLRGHEDQGEERQILMSGNEQSYNNTRNFDFSLKPGGINITDGCSGLTIENNLAWRNHMFGVSMDSQSKDIVLEKSFFQDNILGVYAEETDSIIVKNNIFNENFYAAGLDSTSNTHVLFNTFHANEYAFTAMDSMGDSPLFQNNHIQNNLFSDSLIVDLGLYIPDFLDEGNTSDYNAYARASQEIANIWIDEIGFPVFSFSLSSFQDQSGLDQNSVVSASIWPEEHDFAFVPPHDALIIDAGSLELQAVLSDFYGRERPWGMGPDIGAVEYYPDEDIPEYPHELAELDPSVPEQPPEPDMWEISVSVTGEGQVKVNPDQTEYMDGSMVELSVHAGDGWYFVQWQGDLSGSETPVTLVVDEDKNISALFERLYTLSISVEGEGSIIRTPDLSEYESGESVELEAVAADGWEFVGWSGDASGTDTSLVLVMDTDTSVTGVFEEIPEPEPEGEVFVFDPNAYETGYNPVGDVFIQRLPGSSDFGGDTGIAEVSTPVGNKVMQFTTELSSPYFHGGVRWLYWTEFQRDQDQIEFLYLFRRSDPEYTELLGCMRMSGEAELNTYAAGLRNNSDEIRGRRVLQGNIINAGEENHNLSGDTVGDWIWVRGRMDQDSYTIRSRAWLHGDNEPENWMLEWTDQEAGIASGGAGLEVYLRRAGDSIDLAWWSVGFGGAAAEFPEEETYENDEFFPPEIYGHYFDPAWAEAEPGLIRDLGYGNPSEWPVVNGHDTRIVIQDEQSVDLKDIRAAISWDSGPDKYGTTYIHIRNCEEVVVENVHLLQADQDYLASHTLFIEDCGKVILRDSSFHGSVERHHVRMEGNAEVIIDNVEISGYDYGNGIIRTGGGIRIENGDESRGGVGLASISSPNPRELEWLQITNCHIRDNLSNPQRLKHDGILIHSGGNSLIYNNLFENWQELDAAFDTSHRRWQDNNYVNKTIHIEKNRFINNQRIKMPGRSVADNSIVFYKNYFENSGLYDYHIGYNVIFRENLFDGVFDSTMLTLWQINGPMLFERNNFIFEDLHMFIREGGAADPDAHTHVNLRDNIYFLGNVSTWLMGNQVQAYTWEEWQNVGLDTGSEIRPLSEAP